MPHGGVNQVPPTQQAIRASWPIEQPGGGLPGYKQGDQTMRPIGGFGSTRSPGTQAPNQQSIGIKPPGTGYTSFVGTTTAGLSAPVW